MRLGLKSPSGTADNYNFKKEKSQPLLVSFFLSGYQDSNLGPPAPKASAIWFHLVSFGFK